MSDRSRLPLGIHPLVQVAYKGRRRPFMIVGSVLVGLNLLIIGWTREIGSWFASVDSDEYPTLVIWIAVVSIYLLDFAINAGPFPTLTRSKNQYKLLVVRLLWIHCPRKNKRSGMHGQVEWLRAVI
jgi:hypothetical protein